MTATLVLQDGTVLQGQAFSAQTGAVLEMFFNTSMTGYQKGLTAPSYKGRVQLNLNTPLGPHAHSAGADIRAAAAAMNVPLLTTLSAGMAAVNAIQTMHQKGLTYRSIQEHLQNAG
jgi:carbamoylphosphate synthase small subunit